MSRINFNSVYTIYLFILPCVLQSEYDPLIKQCAAVSTNSSSISVPPHRLIAGNSFSDSSCKISTTTKNGNRSGSPREPPKIARLLLFITDVHRKAKKCPVKIVRVKTSIFSHQKITSKNIWKRHEKETWKCFWHKKRFKNWFLSSWWNYWKVCKIETHVKTDIL